MRKAFTALVAVSSLVLSIQTASADSFQGSVWSLSYSGSPLTDSDPLHETFRVTLSVDTTAYNGGGSFLDQVALKVSDSLSAASLFDAPGGTSSWSLVAGGLNAKGCSGSGSGFECANSTLMLNNGKGVAVGSIHEWIFDLTMDNGDLFTGLLQSSVKGRFVDAAGNKIGALVSENVTLTSPVPEPEVYAMMLAGLGTLIAAMARRRRRQVGPRAACTLEPAI